MTVTADHSHVFTIGGYPKRGNPVLGLQKEIDGTLAIDLFNKTFTTLGYADGPGGLNGSRPDLRTVNTTDKNFLQQATVLLDSESHGSEDIGENKSFTTTPTVFIRLKYLMNISKIAQKCQRKVSPPKI